MLSMMLFAFGVAIALFLVTNFLSKLYIEKRYLSEESKAERAAEYKEELQQFVTSNNLSCDDAKEISKWAQKNKYLYIQIYKDDKLLFESGQYEEEKEPDKTPDDDPETGENKENADDKPGNSVENDKDQTGTDAPGEGEVEPENPGNGENGDTEGEEDGTSDVPEDESKEEGNENDKPDSADKEDNKYPSSGITVKTPTREELIAEAVASGSYPIVASDGVLLASMVDYTEYLYYDIFNIVSILLAFASFILVMWFYFYDITKRIARLGREVTAVADGEMTRTITASGEDEITRLCTDVEYMRSSMLENIEKEHAALESNRELITAMSHDIRTPLTVLLGYIDIMKFNTQDADMQQYIEASERTALRLKKMSDDMFSYFLAYGGGIEVSIQECDAKTLIDQMLSGHVFLLREQGYDIDFDFESDDSSFPDDVIVVTDPPQLMRIVENIFSNIMKYADVEKKIVIKIGVETDEMSIKVSNYVRSNPDEAQKNGIGLRSCMKLANAMDIQFTCGEDGGIYTSTLQIPIIPRPDPDADAANEEIGGLRKWMRSVSQKCKSFFAKTWAKLKDFVLRKE